jgi:hypothetical protein
MKRPPRAIAAERHGCAAGGMKRPPRAIVAERHGCAAAA